MVSNSKSQPIPLIKPKINYYHTIASTTINGYSSESNCSSPPPSRRRPSGLNQCHRQRLSYKVHFLFCRESVVTEIFPLRGLWYFLLLSLLNVSGLIMCVGPFSFMIRPRPLPGSVYRSYEIFQKLWDDIQSDNWLAIEMGQQNKLMRNLLGILRDKASLIKAALSIKRTSSSLHVAVLRATTHSPSSPPPDHRVAAVLSLGNGSRPTACACVGAIMDRLHTTPDTFVALKCLITLHHIVARGSFILKDQLSFYPSVGGRNFLNLSRFRDGRDTETWELSSWVRWYAGVLERNLITSRVLGMYISSSSMTIHDGVTITSLLNSDLIRDIDALVSMVEEICRAPDSLHFQQNNLVYEVVNLVGEDYRSTQHQILIRLSECGERINGLNSGESDELTRCLKRLEDCRERLSALFMNRKRNDAFWDLVNETKTKLARMEEEEREREKWLVRLGRRREEESESTRFGERVLRPSQLLMLPYGGQWLGVDRGEMAVPSAMA